MTEKNRDKLPSNFDLIVSDYHLAFKFYIFDTNFTLVQQLLHYLRKD